MCLKFGFVFFGQKDFGAKAAHKMLVKLTPCGQYYKPFFQRNYATIGLGLVQIIRKYEYGGINHAKKVS